MNYLRRTDPGKIESVWDVASAQVPEKQPGEVQKDTIAAPVAV